MTYGKYRGIISIKTAPRAERFMIGIRKQQTVRFTMDGGTKTDKSFIGK